MAEERRGGRFACYFEELENRQESAIGKRQSSTIDPRQWLDVGGLTSIRRIQIKQYVEKIDDRLSGGNIGRCAERIQTLVLYDILYAFIYRRGLFVR